MKEIHKIQHHHKNFVYSAFFSRSRTLKLQHEDVQQVIFSFTINEVLNVFQQIKLTKKYLQYYYWV